MRRIREARDVDLDTIHEATRIARTLVETFEETGLVDHPGFNRVYLRSFIRAYAECVDIPKEDALGALDDVLAGDYAGELAQQHLPGTSAQAEDSAAGSDATDEAEGDVLAPSRGADSDGDVASQDAQFEGDQSEGDQSAEREGTGEASFSVSDKSAAGAPTSREAAQTASARPEPSPSRQASSRAASESFLETHRREIIVGLIALLFVLALAAVGALVLFNGSEPSSASPTPEGAEAATQATDTAVTEAAATSRRLPAALSLGDTLHLTVQAVGDVRGIRIQRDDDLRRPYWIEAGEAAVFPFQERISIEEQLDSIRLFFERYRFPLDSRNAQGRIVITRTTAQSVADTLRGTPIRLTVPTDTIPVPSF